MKNKTLYFIALIPPEPIKSEIMRLKKEVYERFNSKAALRSPAHITMHMPFEWRTDKEGELKEKLKRFNHESMHFEVELKGFGFFDPRVVFVNVIKSRKLEKLQKELVKYVRNELKILNANYKDMGFHPHMTIGFRDIKKDLFDDLKAFYTNKKYNASFNVDAICLLKHDGKVWEEEMYF